MRLATLPREESPRFRLLRAGIDPGDFGRDVREGLTALPKTLPPRWFYDELGSSLFDTICFLPEYYVMRAEAEILTRHRTEIATAFGPRIRLVELGSGAARKTRVLLDPVTALQPELEYVPVDVDEGMLERVARDLLGEHPRLRITAVRGDLARPSAVLSLLDPSPARTVVLFLGSTIGNFEPPAACELLRDLRSALRPGDALFLGADLRKPSAILEPAYDDALGVTAAFNLNLLARINRELGGAFDLQSFEHQAFYDPGQHRIEMHLVSRCAQTVRIEQLDLEIAFRQGESIHTESSFKYDRDSLDALAADTGFAVRLWWTDARGWFADALLVAE